MTKYILHRIFQMIPILVLISVIVFALLTSMPGDPLDRMLEDNPDFTFEDYMRLRAIPIRTPTRAPPTIQQRLEATG